MTVSLSRWARDNAGNAIIALIDNGSLNIGGYMEIRTGSRPTTPQSAANGILLAELVFSDPAFGAMGDGVATAHNIISDTSIPGTGKAQWFRIYDKDGNVVLDGTVTKTGGGGDITFPDVNFIAGGTVSITNLTAIMPQE